MDEKNFNAFLSTIDIPKNQIAHDLALLIVKSKMESRSITTLGQVFETYVEELHGMQSVVKRYMGE